MTGERDPIEGPDTLPEIRVDASNLRGLAHPLRLRALGLLRRNGPATASQLAARMGESSGSLSYHLRQLAAYGFIIDDKREGGRERWWRAAHRSTRFDDRAAVSDEDRMVGAEFLGLVARVYADRLIRFGDHLDTLEEEVGPEYARAATTSDWNLRLTPERATEFADAVERLAESYRTTPDSGDTVLPVNVLFAVLPGRDA